MGAEKTYSAKLTSCSPYLVVRNLAENVAFFEEKLGFELLHEDADIEFAMVGRDDVVIMLRGTSHDPSSLASINFHAGSWPEGFELYDLSIQVTDVDAYHAELVQRCANPHALEHRPYGKDTGVSLPDGYQLVFLQLGG